MTRMPELVVINLHIKFEVGLLILNVHLPWMWYCTIWCRLAYVWCKSKHSHWMHCHMRSIALWCCAMTRVTP